MGVEKRVSGEKVVVNPRERRLHGEKQKREETRRMKPKREKKGSSVFWTSL